MTDASGERWQAEVNARLARLELRADEAEVADAGFDAARRGGPIPAEEYPDLDTWVRDYFCATFSRPLGGEFRWCAQWRQHREAVVRLEALWCSWRALRRDPALGMSTWFHQFLDPQLSILLSARGSFAQCSMSRHEPAITLRADGFSQGSAKDVVPPRPETSRTTAGTPDCRHHLDVDSYILGETITGWRSRATQTPFWTI